MATQTRLIRGLAGLATGLTILVPEAWSLCLVPQPRLICAEYANSQAVVIAELVGIREVVDKDDFIAGYFYSLATRTSLRGQVGPTFQVWEENSSGRATFGWTRGTTYVLFLYSKRDDAWVIDGCGNSGPIGLSEDVLAAVKAAQSNSGDALLEGMVSTGSWTTGVPDVAIRAMREGTTATAKTDQDGRFQMRLPAGQYRIDAVRSGWAFDPTPFSYENPSDLRLAPGGCAQVHFNGAQSR